MELALDALHRGDDVAASDGLKIIHNREKKEKGVDALHGSDRRLAPANSTLTTRHDERQFFAKLCTVTREWKGCVKSRYALEDV